MYRDNPAFSLVISFLKHLSDVQHSMAQDTRKIARNYRPSLLPGKV